MTREHVNDYINRLDNYSKTPGIGTVLKRKYSKEWIKPYETDKIIFKDYIIDNNGNKIIDEAFNRGLLNNTTFPINDRKKSFEITIIIKDEALELPPYFKL